MTILEIINRTSEITGRKEKVNFVRENLSESLCGVFYMTLNPFLRFGFKSIPQYDTAKEGKENVDLILSRLLTLSEMNHSKKSEEWLVKSLEMAKPCDRPVIEMIVLKDLRCGVQTATWNEIIKGTEYEHYNVTEYPCMLASVLNEKRLSKLPWESGVYTQLKCDGMRFNAIVEHDKVSFYGRSGKPITIKSESLKEQFRQLNINGEPTVYDGELLVLNESGNGWCDRKTGNGILNKAVRDTINTVESERVCCVLWDMIPLDAFKRGLYNVPYHLRYTDLIKRVETLGDDAKIMMVESQIVHSLEDARKIYEEYVKRGLEGVILKSPNNVWKDTRATDQIKMKEELDADLRIVEVVEGTGKYRGMMGALVLESDDKMVRVSVGTGFTDEQRKEYFTDSLLDKVVTVTYNMRIKDKNRMGVDSLFLPRFIEIREDKNVTNTDKEIK